MRVFKVGDLVFHDIHGVGTIFNIKEKEKLPIEVRFNGITVWYTIDGKTLNGEEIVLVKLLDEGKMALIDENSNQLTKREQAAIAAMQGMLACSHGVLKLEAIATLSVRAADLLFDELNKE